MKSFKEYYLRYISESPERTGPLGFENKTNEELGHTGITTSNAYSKVFEIPSFNVSIWQYQDGDDFISHFVDNKTNESVGYVTYEIFEDGGV